MPIPKYTLRAFTAIMAMLALYSINPTALAMGTGKTASWTGTTLQGVPCRGARIPFGPYDYLERARYPGQLFITEEYHLTPEILRLQQATTTSAINDIQYTLMAWPNHHKALYAAYQYRLTSRGQWYQDINAATPVECHLMRAIKFSPRDPVPHMILGLLLHNFEQYKPALEAFRTANKLLPNDVITLYNMGLTLVELEKYDEAVEVANEVYLTDFPLQGLKHKLARAGHWEAESAEMASEDALSEEVSAEAGTASEAPAVEEMAEDVPANAPEEAFTKEEMEATNLVLEESAPTGDEGVDTSVVSE